MKTGISKELARRKRSSDISEIFDWAGAKRGFLYRANSSNQPFETGC